MPDDLTLEKRAELRRLAMAAATSSGDALPDWWYAARDLTNPPKCFEIDRPDAELMGALSPAVTLSLLDALDSRDAELVKLKSTLTKFTPSKRDPNRCLLCEELRVNHYSGPFAEPNTAYCHKYDVPRKASTP